MERMEKNSIDRRTGTGEQEFAGRFGDQGTGAMDNGMV